MKSRGASWGPRNIWSRWASLSSVDNEMSRSSLVDYRPSNITASLRACGSFTVPLCHSFCIDIIGQSDWYSNKSSIVVSYSKHVSRGLSRISSEWVSTLVCPRPRTDPRVKSQTTTQDDRVEYSDKVYSDYQSTPNSQLSTADTRLLMSLTAIYPTHSIIIILRPYLFYSITMFDYKLYHVYPFTP